jgi:hypothetical protein
MTNEQYLIVSYFVSGCVSIALGALVYFYVRRSFGEFAAIAPGKSWPALLKKVFPFGLILPALLGFLSVSYKSCNHTSYEKIVESRSYLVDKNKEQLSTTLLSLVIAILLWDLVLIVVRKYSEKASHKH